MTLSRHDQPLARRLRDAAVGEQPGDEAAAAVVDGHPDRHLPCRRVGSRADPLDLAGERLVRIAAHLEHHLGTDPHQRQRLGRHRRLELDARRIDDGVERGAGRHDVAGVDRPSGDDARDRRHDGGIALGLARRAQAAAWRWRPRTRAGPLRCARASTARSATAPAVDQLLGAGEFAPREVERLLLRAHRRLRRGDAPPRPCAPRCGRAPGRDAPPAPARPHHTTRRRARRARWPGLRASSVPDTAGPVTMSSVVTVTVFSLPMSSTGGAAGVGRLVRLLGRTAPRARRRERRHSQHRQPSPMRPCRAIRVIASLIAVLPSASRRRRHRPWSARRRPAVCCAAPLRRLRRAAPPAAADCRHRPAGRAAAPAVTASPAGRARPARVRRRHARGPAARRSTRAASTGPRDTARRRSCRRVAPPRPCPTRPPRRRAPRARWRARCVDRVRTTRAPAAVAGGSRRASASAMARLALRRPPSSSGSDTEAPTVQSRRLKRRQRVVGVGDERRRDVDPRLELRLRHLHGCLVGLHAGLGLAGRSVRSISFSAGFGVGERSPLQRDASRPLGSVRLASSSSGWSAGTLISCFSRR